MLQSFHARKTNARGVTNASAQEQRENIQKRIETTKKALEYAQLASYVYEHYEHKTGGTELPAEWEVMDKKELHALGVTAEMLRDQTDKDGHSFAAVVLKSTSQKKIVISYRGSVGTPLFSHNWVSNINEGSGQRDYTTEHTMAMELAEKMQRALAMSDEWKDYSLSFAGHSLGGGLASAASIVTGLDAFTMDSAPVRIKTIATYLKCSEDDVKERIKAVAEGLKTMHTTTDPITNVFPTAHGEAHSVQPAGAHQHEATVFWGPSALGISDRPLVTAAMSPLFAIAAILVIATGQGGPGTHNYMPLGGALYEAGKRALAGHDHKFLISALREDIARMEKGLR